MNDLREQIKELVRQQQFMSDDGGLVADRILSLLPRPEAEAKLPVNPVAIDNSPFVTHADMRRLAEVLDNSRSSWISRAINEVFKEPA